MSVVHTAAVTFGGGAAAREEDPAAPLLGVVLERSAFVACLTDAEGTIRWASPAFRTLVAGDGDPVGRSLFALAGGRAAKLAVVLRAVLEAPLREAAADIDVGDLTSPRFLRVTAENLCADPDVRGVLWSQAREVTPERVERLTRSLVNIAREVEWIGFGRKRANAQGAPVGLLPGSEQLSDRERAVVTMLGQGESVNAIAQRLFVNPSTVRNYLSSMYRKLGVADLAGLRELLARGPASPAPCVVEDVER